MNHLSTGNFRNKLYFIFFERDRSAFLRDFGIALILYTLSILQIRGFGRLSFSFFYFGVIFLCFSAINAIRHRDDVKPQFQRNAIFLLIIELFSLLYFYNNIAIITAEIGKFHFFVLLIALLLVVLAHTVQIFFTIHKIKLNHVDVLRIAVLTGICFIFSFFLNVECFNTIPRWDSFSYFNASDRLSAADIFSPGMLNIAGHISGSYSLLCLLFYSIPGISHLNALYLSNMFLMSIDFILFYLIFKYLLPRARMFTHVLYSIIAICSPWIFGSISSISQEHILLTGVLLMIWSAFQHNFMLCLLSSYIVCNSRETGPMVAAAIILLQLIYDILRLVRYKQRRTVAWYYYFLCLGIGIMWLFEYRSGNWSAANQESYATTHLLMQDGHAINTFGFHWVHIKDTLYGALFSSFSWLLFAFFCIAIVVYIVQVVRKRASRTYVGGFSIILAALISFIVETAAYVTYNLYRYYTVPSALLYILGLCSIYYLFRIVLNRPFLHYFMTTVIGVLILVQAHLSIDPLMNSVCYTLDTGHATLSVMPQHMNLYTEPAMAEFAFTNRQIMYFDKALDKVFSALPKTDGSSKVLCSNEFTSLPKHSGSLLCIWGYGYSYIDPPRWVAWNEVGQYRYLSDEQENAIDPSFVMADADLSVYTNDFEHVYYLEMPWGDTVLGALQERYPSISFYQTIEYRGWVLNLYKIK